MDQKTLADLYSIIDKMGQRNIFHKNKVKRLKAKYARKGKSASTAGVSAKKAVEKKVVAKKKVAAKKKTSKKVVK